MKKIFNILIICLLFSEITMAQYPKQCQVSTPKFLKETRGISNFQDWAVKTLKNYSSMETSSFWIVFSDRENNQTFKESDPSSKLHSKLGFREKLYIADIENGYALVYSSEKKQLDFPNIEEPKWKGWILLDNLLLWNECPKNENQIYNKGVVVYSPNKEASSIQKNPNYLLAPKTNATQSPAFSSDLDILYCMKKCEVDGKNYFLVSKVHILDPNSRDVEAYLLGWLSEDYLTEWNFRLCLEPTYANQAVNYYKNKDIYPAIFPENDNGMYNARSYSRGEGAKNPLWVYEKDKFISKRMDNNRMRNPILDHSGDLYRVATLSTFNQEEVNIDELNKAKSQWQKWKDAQDHINLIFVIDNTSSMRNYYPAVAKSLEEIMTYDIKSKIQIGAVLYKDYSDKQNVTYKKLTSNIQEIISFINSGKDNCFSADPDAYEAMFMGLETALDMIKMGYNEQESNFIILIGDAGNHRTVKGQSWENIVSNLASKMSQNNINFLAYQVNNSGVTADRDFGLQIGVLQKEYAEKISAKIKEKTYYNLKDNRFYTLEKINNETLLPIFVTYSYLKTGQSETSTGLKSIILDNYNDYIKVVSSKFRSLSEVLNRGKTVDGLDEEVARETLQLMNIPTSEINKIIQTIKSGGVVKFFGYTPNKVKSAPYNLFDYVLLFSDKELSKLIHSLDKINSVSANDAKALQDALIDIGQSMLGNFNQDGNVSEMLEQIYGLPVPLNVCGDLKFDDIIDEEKLSKEDLNRYIEDFNRKFTELRKIKYNKSFSFKAGDQIYYWIPLSYMPGICE